MTVLDLDEEQGLFSLIKLLVEQADDQREKKESLAQQLISLFQEHQEQRSHFEKVIKRQKQEGNMALAAQAAAEKRAEAAEAKLEEARISEQRWRQGYEIAVEEIE